MEQQEKNFQDLLKQKKLRAYKFPVSVGVPHYASRTFFWSNLNTAAPLHRRSYSSFVYLYISIYLPVLSLWAFEVCIVCCFDAAAAATATTISPVNVKYVLRYICHRS